MYYYKFKHKIRQPNKNSDNVMKSGITSAVKTDSGEIPKITYTVKPTE